jgi:formate hydrogenlyase subunit 3/multisubunit Na+/H+ antiporter MnhD subunit
MGTISALLGVIYALKEHDIKRLLAYHSIENIGIILIGFGLYIIERSVSRVTYDEPVLDVCRICLEQIAGGGEA